MSSRQTRTEVTRTKEARRTPWKPPSTLDAPPAPEGFKHRWIRTSVMGFLICLNANLFYTEPEN